MPFLVRRVLLISVLDFLHPYVHGGHPGGERESVVRSIFSQPAGVLLQSQTVVRAGSHSVPPPRGLSLYGDFPRLHQIRSPILLTAFPAFYAKGDFFDLVLVRSLLRAGIYACTYLHDRRPFQTLHARDLSCYIFPGNR